MRILFLNWRDTSHPKAGGAEQLTENIAAELARRDHQVTLLCPSFPGCRPEENKRGYRVIRHGHQITVRFHAWRLWQKEFRRHRNSICVDQIHGLPFFTPFYSHRHTLAFIHEVAGQCWEYNFPFPLSTIGKIAEKTWLQLYRRTPFITVSQSTKQELIDAGIPEHAISIIPESVDIAPLPSPIFHKSDPIVTSLGRIAPIKNIGDTIKACLLLRKTFPNIKLWIIGSGHGRYYQDIIKMAEQHPDFITVWGYVNDTKKIELLSRSKILTSTSHKEGYGLNIIEAAACGVPSVAYNVGGLREAIINNQTGLLTDQNTPVDLARKLEKLLTNDDLYQTLARKAWQRSHDFSSQKTADAFEKNIRQLNLS
ncbi:MAG: glycosyltransferase family 4 protein [bacterium]|nr:glycosyltransferase family 4 protein [bacterium]MDZ4341980.1 glycosyltransferase family 4 protein [Candidatus Binatia bacterium]